MRQATGYTTLLHLLSPIATNPSFATSDSLLLLRELQFLLETAIHTAHLSERLGKVFIVRLDVRESGAVFIVAGIELRVLLVECV